MGGSPPPPSDLPIKLGASFAESLHWPVIPLTVRNTAVPILPCAVMQAFDCRAKGKRSRLPSQFVPIGLNHIVGGFGRGGGGFLGPSGFSCAILKRLEIGNCNFLTFIHWGHSVIFFVQGQARLPGQAS